MNNSAWLVTLAFIATGSALAQTAPAPATALPASLEANFKAADKDNDGTIDKAEAAARPGLARRFDAIDTDHDGSIDLHELEAHHAQLMQRRADRLERRFKAADTNHDGTIDQKEAASWPGLARRFTVVDTDKDGTVDPAELKQAMGKPKGLLLDAPSTLPPTAETDK